jgi:hypothetical protein
MYSRKLPFALVALALGACSVDASDPAAAETKQAARDRLQNAASDSSGTSAGSTAPTTGNARPTAPADVCLLQKWYDDGECDVWCPKGDPGDCDPSGSDVICAAFFSPADGYCNRNDPCGPVQDEDCQKGGSTPPSCPPTPHPLPSDGKCDPRSYDEFKTDPDCAVLGCPALFSPADGKCEPKRPCDYVIDEDCAKSGGNSGSPTPCTDGREPDGCGSPGNPGGVACDDILYGANGRCEAPPGCERNDPQDCPVACDAILYGANGRCEAAPGCEASDPQDCPVACIDIAYATNGKCEAAPGCEANDPEDCGKPVACLAILYPTNGKCEAAPGCEGSDPEDCVKPVACRAILYPTNGKCEAGPGCEASDPVDCGGVICPAILYGENGKCEAGPGCERSDPDC